MALVVTDALDPGLAQVADGISPGFGPGVIVGGSTTGRKTLKQKIVTLTFSGTYATGGELINKNKLGGLFALFCVADPAGGFLYVPTYETDGTITLKLFWKVNDAVFAEITNGTAISTVVRLMVWGRET